MRNGFVTRFRRRDVLDDVVSWLNGHGYAVHRVDGVDAATQADFLREVGEELDFPDYYNGGSLDAFADCLRDVATYDYGTSREATGTVLVFTGYDDFAGREPRAAQVILDIVADTARTALLFGHRVLCLVQADDPALRFAPVGATPVEWNTAESRSATP